MDKKISDITFDEFLKEEGIYDEVVEMSDKQIVAFQIADEMKRQNVTKSELAKKMHTSRSCIDNLLDPNHQPTMASLHSVAEALGKKIRIELI